MPRGGFQSWRRLGRVTVNQKKSGTGGATRPYSRALIIQTHPIALKLLARAAVLAALFAPGFAGKMLGADASVILTVSPAAGPAIPEGFSGLSYEVASVLPEPGGSHYFGPDNARLIALFRSLGIANLRIGGNSSDRDAGRLPGRADLDALFGFARAAGVKVIYCLRLRGGDPAADAATAKYLMDRYGDLVDCFSIGQEPSAYPVGKAETRPPGERMGAPAEKFPYSEYRDEWRNFARTIAAAVPNVRLCGPSVHNNAQWADEFIRDFARGYNVVLITEHLYPGGAAGKLPSNAVGRDRMLSDRFVAVCEKLYRGFVPEAAAAGLPYRLEETNSYFNGGRLGASDRFAAALWGLDYMYWWAAHGASGLNFHTGERVSMNGVLHAPPYGVFTRQDDGFSIHPLAYAIKAFALTGHGRMAAVALRGAEGINLSAYAVDSADGRTTLILVNKEHGPGARGVSVQVGRWASAAAAYLRDQDGDVAAAGGITLGGAPIDARGGWAGRWQPVEQAPDGSVAIPVPAATAALVRLVPGR